MFARFKHPYLLLTLTSLFWAGNFVVGRAIRADVPPLSLAFWRWTIALLLWCQAALLLGQACGQGHCVSRFAKKIEPDPFADFGCLIGQ